MAGRRDLVTEAVSRSGRYPKCQSKYAASIMRRRAGPDGQLRIRSRSLCPQTAITRRRLLNSYVQRVFRCRVQRRGLRQRRVVALLPFGPVPLPEEFLPGCQPVAEQLLLVRGRKVEIGSVVACRVHEDRP